MEYIFGNVRRNGIDCDNLKTIGEEHSNLSGFISVTRKYADNIITDNARIREHYRSEEGPDGLCYDWYTLYDHYRIEDKFTPCIGKTEQEITDLEIENIEQGIALTDAEIAIIELQSQIDEMTE